jgi:hypothetical protein
MLTYADVWLGDFGIYRMNDIKEVSFVGGFARAGAVTVSE